MACKCSHSQVIAASPVAEATATPWSATSSWSGAPKVAAHGGQLALPGGQRDPGDADLAATALREADEVVEVPVADLARTEVGAEEVRDFPTWPAPRRTQLWRVGPYEVWGVTYRILEPLVRDCWQVSGRCDGHPACEPAVADVGRRAFMVGMRQSGRDRISRRGGEA
jgi:hypothetical protein